MGIHRGSNIIRSGLEFAFDTGYTSVLSNEDSYISNQGEPTTNLFTNPNFTNHTDVTVGTTSIIKQDFGGGKVGIKMIQAGTSDIASFSMGAHSTPTSAGTYTWSSFIHSTSTGGKVKAQVTVYVNGTRHWLTSSNTWTTSVTECTHLFVATVANQWHRIENQFTLPTGTLTNLQLGSFYRTTSNFTIKIANAQFELKSHRTPFTVSSRSSTASLLELTRQSTIDLANVSFDSNAHMTFDGTNDNIPFTSKTLGNGNWTAEFIVKAHSSTYSLMSNSSGGPVANAFGVYANKMHYRNYSGGWQNHNSSTTVNYNQIYHLTYVNRTGNTMDMYINGVKDSSSGFTSTTSNGGPVNAIGRSWNGYFDGEIYLHRRYNIGLTDAEVAQNFSAYRDRFNI